MSMKRESNVLSKEDQFKEFERRRDALLRDIVSDDFQEAMGRLQLEVYSFMCENVEYDTEENRKYFKIKSQ